jgi:DNA gyrase inhibitor GyrI
MIEKSIFTRPVPEPLDPAVMIREIPSRTIAVLRFSGTVGEQVVRQRTKHLLSVLEKERIGTTGAPFLMRYNSP